MKIALSAIGGVLVLLIAAVLVVPSLIDWNAYRAEIAARGTEALGREIFIGGDISLALLPAPNLVVRDVRVANLRGATDPDMVRLKSLEARVALVPLLSGQIKVETFKLVDPVIALEILPDGRRNWDLSVDDPKPAKPVAGRPGASSGSSSPVEVSLDNVIIQNGRLFYRDALSMTDERIDYINLRLSAGSLDGPFQVDGRLTAHGFPVTVDVTVGDIRGATPVPVGITAGLESTNAKFQLIGTLVGLGERPRLRGRFVFDAPDPAGLARALGGTLPPMLAQAMSAQAEVNATATDVELTNFNAAFGETKATGTVTATLAPKVAIQSRLKIAHLNLDRVAAKPTSATVAQAPAAKDAPAAGRASAAIAPPPVPARPKSTEPMAIPTTFTAGLKAEVDSITYRGGSIRQATLDAEISNGEIVIKKLQAQFPGSSDAAVFGFVSLDKGAPRFEGNVEANANELRRIFEWLGVAVPPVAGDRLRRLTMKADVRATPAEVQISGLDLQIDSSWLKGGVTVALRERLAFGSDLTLDRLNLDAYMTSAPAPSATAAKPAAAAAAAAKPAPGPAAGLGALSSFDANVKMKIDALEYQGVPIRNIALDGTLFDGALDLRSFSVGDAAGAKVQASGKISGLAGAPELAGFQIDASAADVGRVASLFKVELPLSPAKIGAVQLKGRFDGPMLGPKIALDLTAAGGSAEIEATPSVLALLGQPMTVTVRKLSHPDLRALLARLDIDYRPAGALGGIDLAAQIAVQPTSIAVTNLKGKIGATTLEGTATVGLGGPKPKIVADLKAGHLVLDPFLPAKRTADLDSGRFGVPARRSIVPVADARAAPGRWATDPIDVSALSTVDADIKLQATGVTYDKTWLRDVHLAAVVADGVLRAENFQGTLFGAAVSGSGNVRAGAADAKVSIKNVSVREAVAMAAGKDGASGVIDLDLDLKTTGTSMAQMVAGLGGDARLAARGLNAESGSSGSMLAPIVGVVGNLNQVMGALGGRPEGGGLADVTASFRIERGIARTQDFRLTSVVANGQAQGMVDLPNWTIDATGELRYAQNVLTQLLSRKVNTQETIPLTIKGTLDSPEIKIGTGNGTSAIPGAESVLDKLIPDNGVGRVLRGVLGGPSSSQPQQQQPPSSSTTQQGQPQTQPQQQRPSAQDLIDIFRRR